MQNVHRQTVRVIRRYEGYEDNMSKYRLKAFGITKEIIGRRDVEFEGSIQTVADLRAALKDRYPELGTLRSLLIAINSEYAGDDQTISENDEIALIPPVSGG